MKLFEGSFLSFSFSVSLSISLGMPMPTGAQTLMGECALLEINDELSGLDWNTELNAFIALSDDRKKPKTYFLKLAPNLWNELECESLGQPSSITGYELEQSVFDGESIRWLNPQNGSSDFLIATEGRKKKEKKESDPAIFIVSSDFRVRQKILLPQDFLIFEGENETVGARNNLSLESLAITPKFVFTAFEEPPYQYGPRPSFESGATTPIFIYERFSIKQNSHTESLAFYKKIDYELSAVPRPSSSALFNWFVSNPKSEEIQNGITELLYLEDDFSSLTHLLVLERAQISLVSLPGAPAEPVYSTRLYELVFDPILGVIQKHLFLDLAQFSDNFEAMSLGPTFLDGRKSLYLMTDSDLKPTKKTRVFLIRLI